MGIFDNALSKSRELIGEFKDQTNAFINKNKDEEAIVFIKSTISTFETMLKAIDTFLKKKNVDVGKAVETGKDVIHKASNVAKNVAKEAANSSLGQKLKSKGEEAYSKVKSLFAKSDNKDTAPPDSKPSFIQRAITEGNRILSENKLDRFRSDNKEESPIKPKGIFATLKEKVKARAAKKDTEVAEEKKAVKDVVEKKEVNKPKGGLLGGLLSGGVGLLGKAASGILTKVVPTVASGIAKGTTTAVGGLAKGAAKTAIETVKPNSKKQRKADRKLKVKKATFDKAKERDDKNDKEVAEEKKAVLEQAEKDKAKKDENAKGGWLSKILGAVTSLGGMLMGGLGTLGKFAVGGIGKVIKFGAGFLFKGLTKTLFSIVPKLSGGIAKSLQGLVGNVLKGGWGLAKTGLKAGLRAALPFAGKALAMAGKGLVTAATAIGPVGWVVLGVGAALFGGYLLYKYLSKNDVADDFAGKLTRLRLLMYGFNDTNKEYYSKIFDVEMLLKDFIEYKEGKLLMKPFDKEFKEKILEIFKVEASEKEKFAILQTWFIKRMIPAYRAFMTAFKGINPALYLDDLDKLKDGDIPILLSKLNIPLSIYDIKQAPTFDTTNTNIVVNKQEIDNYISNILTSAKSKEPKVKPVTQVQTKPITTPTPMVVKSPEKTYSSARGSANVDKQLNQPQVQTKDTIAPSHAEGEEKPKEEPTKSDTVQTKVSGKLNVATGKLSPGTTSMVGITRINKEKIISLDPNVKELFTGMAKEYNTLTGKSIPVSEAFRSYKDQEALYKSKPKGQAAKPGNSTHEYGLALDIDTPYANELDKLGLLRKYGFTRPVQGETWHLEPIGVSLNPGLAKKDPNFRNTAVVSSIGRGGGGFGAKPSQIKGHRDIGYQNAIFNQKSDTPVDVQKALAAIKDTSLPTPSTPVKITDKVDKPEQTTTTDNNKSKVDVIESVDPKEQALVKPTKTPIVKPEVNTNIETTPPVVTANTNTDVGKVADLKPEQAIEQAAKLTGVDKDTLMAFAKIESGLNPSAKPSTSRAAGLFQIVPNTWKGLMSKYGAMYNIPSDAKPENSYYNAILAAEYAKENLSKLGNYKEAKLEESTAMYLAHHFGVSGANNIINQILSDPNKPMEQTVSPSSFKANRQELTGQTAGSYAKMVALKINKAGNTKYPSQVSKPSEQTSVSSIKNDSDTNSLTQDTSYNNKPIKTDTPSVTDNTFDQKTYLKPSGDVLNKFSTDATPQINDRVRRPLNAFNDTITKTLEEIKKPNPSINSTSYSSMTNKVDKAASPVQSTPEFSTGKMEDILTDQLTNLTQIVSILTSIDGKINLDKLKEAIPSQSNQFAKPDLVNMGQSKSAVNLTRRSLTA